MTVETRIRSNSQKAEEEAPSFAPVPGNPGSRPDLFYCTHVCVCLGLKARTYQARYVVLILRRGPFDSISRSAASVAEGQASAPAGLP